MGRLEQCHARFLSNSALAMSRAWDTVGIDMQATSGLSSRRSVDAVY